MSDPTLVFLEDLAQISGDTTCQSTSCPAVLLCFAVIGHRAFNISDAEANYFTEIQYCHYFYEKSASVETDLLRIPIYDANGSVEIKICSKVDHRQVYFLRIPLTDINTTPSAIVVDWYALTAIGGERLSPREVFPKTIQPIDCLPLTSIRSSSAPGPLGPSHRCDTRIANERALANEHSAAAVRLAWKTTSTVDRETKPTVITYKNMAETAPYKRIEGELPVYEAHPGDAIDLKLSELLQRRPDLSVICRIQREAPGIYMINDRKVQLCVSQDPLHAESSGLSVAEGPLLSQCLVPYLQGSCATAKYMPLTDDNRTHCSRDQRLSYDDCERHAYAEHLRGAREGQARLEAMNIALRDVGKANLKRTPC